MQFLSATLVCTTLRQSYFLCCLGSIVKLRFLVRREVVKLNGQDDRGPAAQIVSLCCSGYMLCCTR